MNTPLIVNVADLPRAGQPVLAGRYRVEPADFSVEERLSITLDGAGEHLWLWIEKTGLTTQQAIEILAEAIGRRPRDFGFAGMKDRHARTGQWLSVPWPIKSDLPDWPVRDDLVVARVHRHGRKLKRGAHEGNRFAIRLRDVTGLEDIDLGAITERIRREGVPNYFGEQRFGRHGDNVELARRLFAGQRLSRHKRSIALSAARSYLFNTVLAARVADENWHRAIAGDVFMLAGTNSIFAGAAGDADPERLAARVIEQDIHPTGPMPGRLTSRSVVPEQRAADYEGLAISRHPDLIEGLNTARVDAERRALVLPVAAFSLTIDDGDLVTRFDLPPGAFATSVLREIGRFVDAQRPDGEARG